ncbi:DUF58 domain-containing protein, partial [Candidatus Saccharibacteria bacterium]|nr:DUF58 domain-containing protein [Candidatus Saccharibacteria bacterium]
ARRLKLFSRRRVVSVLDGNYDSVFKGKGVELDSLRAYDLGDNIRDIDWRATARTRTTQTKLYSPLRDQRIIVVADSSPSMMLAAQSGLDKREAVFGLIVALGMFVRKNRDLLALCNGQPDGTTSLSKFSNTSNHIEKLLRTYDRDMQRANPASSPQLSQLLGTVLHKVRQRSAVFVVTDVLPDKQELKPILSKLSARHQVFWLQLAASSPFIDQADPTKQIVDIETLIPLEPDVALSRPLQAAWSKSVDSLLTEHMQTCRSTGTAYGFITAAEGLPNELRKMFLQARRYARRR